jgi:flagellar biosynthetic protein FliR
VIEPIAAAFALTMARVATFIYVLPLVGGTNVPRLVKIGLALALSIFFFIDPGNTHVVTGASSWFKFGLVMAREMILGGILGFSLSLFLVPAHIAAEFIMQESGLSFGNVVTATGDGSASPLTTFFELLASLVFFALDLHHVFLLVLQETLTRMPIGRSFELPNWDLVTAAANAEEGGMLLAAPVALCLFLTTLVLALLTRAAPQLNIYSVGFPVRVIVSLVAMVLLLPQLISGIIGLFGNTMALLQLAR